METGSLMAINLILMYNIGNITCVYYINYTTLHTTQFSWQKVLFLSFPNIPKLQCIKSSFILKWDSEIGVSKNTWNGILSDIFNFLKLSFGVFSFLNVACLLVPSGFFLSFCLLNLFLLNVCPRHLLLLHKNT